MPGAPSFPPSATPNNSQKKGEHMEQTKPAPIRVSPSEETQHAIDRVADIAARKTAERKAKEDALRAALKETDRLRALEQQGSPEDIPPSSVQQPAPAPSEAEGKVDPRAVDPLSGWQRHEDPEIEVIRNPDGTTTWKTKE